MIFSYFLLATLAVMVSRTIPVASSFSNQHIRDLMKVIVIDEDGNQEWSDDVLSNECQAEISAVNLVLNLTLPVFFGNNKSYCQNAGGKAVKMEFEGTCVALAPFELDEHTCAGKSCTITELQASADAAMTANKDDNFSGCTDLKVLISGGDGSDSSGALSFGIAGCVMAGLLLSSVALSN